MKLTEEDYEALETVVDFVLTRLTEGKYSFDGGKTWFTGDYKDAMQRYLEKVMKEELKQAACEIAKDDPHIFDDYDGFERVMWSDDSHMKQHGLTGDDRGIYEQIVRDVYRELITMRLHAEREELRRKPRTVEESVRLADISAALYHAERQDMTDDEYARAEKAAERKRDAAEGFDG